MQVPTATTLTTAASPQSQQDEAELKEFPVLIRDTQQRKVNHNARNPKGKSISKIEAHNIKIENVAKIAEELLNSREFLFSQAASAVTKDEYETYQKLLVNLNGLAREVSPEALKPSKHENKLQHDEKLKSELAKENTKLNSIVSAFEKQQTAIITSEFRVLKDAVLRPVEHEKSTYTANDESRSELASSIKSQLELIRKKVSVQEGRRMPATVAPYIADYYRAPLKEIHDDIAAEENLICARKAWHDTLSSKFVEFETNRLLAKWRLEWLTIFRDFETVLSKVNVSLGGIRTALETFRTQKVGNLLSDVSTVELNARSYQTCKEEISKIEGKLAEAKVILRERKSAQVSSVAITDVIDKVWNPTLKADELKKFSGIAEKIALEADTQLARIEAFEASIKELFDAQLLKIERYTEGYCDCNGNVPRESFWWSKGKPIEDFIQRLGTKKDELEKAGKQQ